MAKRRNFEFFAPSREEVARRKQVNRYLRQVPVGHLLSEHRMALLVSPCCLRRLRLSLSRLNGRWEPEPFVRCPGCRRFWNVKATVSPHGFVTRAILSLPALTGRWKRLKK